MQFFQRIAEKPDVENLSGLKPVARFDAKLFFTNGLVSNKNIANPNARNVHEQRKNARKIFPPLCVPFCFVLNNFCNQQKRQKAKELLSFKLMVLYWM